MKTAKVIIGLIILAAALYYLPFVMMCFAHSELWLKWLPIAIECGVISAGIFFIRKRKQKFSIKAKALLLVLLAVTIVTPAFLVLKIRSDRKALQLRAQEFLKRPIPKLLIPNSEGEVGGYYVDTNAGVANGVFGYSRVLIERYATKGRIRWSAAIQGEFACTGDNCLNGNISDEVTTNEEVRHYSAESHAILAQEWRMGFWQWVEDTMEFKSVIPEIEEEDQE